MKPTADDLRLGDATARRRAQTVFDCPFVLEAGAGTGKTSTLVARIVAWCLTPGWDLAARSFHTHATHSRPRAAALTPEPSAHATVMEQIAAHVLHGVVAITFTDATASEMATRVGEALAQIEQGTLPAGVLSDALPASHDDRRARARALLGTLDRLVICTIHAFCRRVLAAHPLEAGLHPGFQVDGDGVLRAEIVRQVIEVRLREAYASEIDDHFLVLAERRVGPQEIESALTVLVEAGVPPSALAVDPFAVEHVREICDELLAQIEAFRSEAGCLRRAKRSQTAAEVLDGIEETIAYLQSNGPGNARSADELAAWLRDTWGERAIRRLARWEKGELTKSEAQCIGAAAMAVALRAGRLRRLLVHLRALQPSVLDVARRALHPLLEAICRELRARGVQTYAGLLRDTRDLLHHHPEICAQVRRGMTQLLVDEFQDTDPAQCEIIRSLALRGAPGDRPGLFLVGDPKQSIYGWRSADLRAYESFISEVRTCGGERHLLSINYRSVPAILAEVTRAVEPVMHEETGLQPAFQPLVPSPRQHGAEPLPATDRGAPVEYWVSWRWDAEHHTPIPKVSSTDAAEIEARALSTDIRTLHDEQGVAWRDIGVLFRTTGDLDVYLTALRESAVPYAVERDKSYYQRREIIEAAALIRCILDPNDQLALLTVLRSAVVGVPDAALIPLWCRGFPKMATELWGTSPRQLEAMRNTLSDAAESLPRDVPGLHRVRGWEDNLLAAMAQIGMLRETFEREAADIFVEQVRTLFLTEATEAARYLGEYRVANLDRFFRTILVALNEGGADPRRLLRDLRSSVAEARAAEEARPREAADNAVQIMTIHKAKGLDFAHVYVMQLHKQSRGNQTPIAEAVEQAGRWEYRLFGAPTPGFVRVETQRAAVEAAEQVRTLYVAMTRAKQRLVLAGRWPIGAAPVDPLLARSQMDLLRSRRPQPPELVSLMAAQAQAGAPAHVDAAAARWVFSGLQRPPTGESPAPVHAARPATAARVAAASHSLTAARVEAASRASRQFHGTASEEAHAALRDNLAERGSGDTSPAIYSADVLPPADGENDRQLAMAVGTAVHRLLESFDLTAEPRRELARQRPRLRTWLAALVGPDRVEPALQRAEALVDRFSQGPLLTRLHHLAEHVIARELPVLLPPPDRDGPVGFIAGAIDLLYRDTATGSLVVVDFKTDAVEDEAAVAERVHAYRLQGAAYARAVTDALRLRDSPRFELWFLSAGRIESVPLNRPPCPAS